MNSFPLYSRVLKLQEKMKKPKTRILRITNLDIGYSLLGVECSMVMSITHLIRHRAKKLKVSSDVKVDITFTGSKSSVNKSLGMFTNAMHGAALNYEYSGMGAADCFKKVTFFVCTEQEVKTALSEKRLPSLNALFAIFENIT